MLCKLLIFTVILSVCRSDYSDNDYTDAVIDMLLNGGSFELKQSDEVSDGQEPMLSGGIWKCGNCDNLCHRNLVYSELNEVDDNIMLTNTSLNIEIAFTMPGMQCVTILSDTPGVVRLLSGACTGDTITLSVASSSYFTINVYD